MKDKILKLSKRLKKLSLSDFSMILETEEKSIQPIIDELLYENKLILNGVYYLYNKKQVTRGHISELPLFFHFHSQEDIDLILKGFCSDVPVNQICNLVSLNKKVTSKFYQYFRQLIYDKQKIELERYFKLTPIIGKERTWFDATVFLYLYDSQLFVSNKILKSVDCIQYTESERLEIKKLYLRYFRKVQNNTYKYNFHLHMAEEIWKYGKVFTQRYNLLKALIKY